MSVHLKFDRIYLMLSEELLKKLYLQKGRSSSEIAKILNYSEHKINYWIKKYNIQKRGISDAMYLKHNPNGDPFKVVGKPRTIEEAILYGLGLGLFWGEGNKKNKNSIRLGNTDPKLICKFIEFLIKVLGINGDKLRFGLQIFDDMPTRKTLKFWLNELKHFGINKNQFFKVTVTRSGSIGNYKEKSKYGVLTVYFGNTKLKKILDGYIADVAQWQSNSMVNYLPTITET